MYDRTGSFDLFLILLTTASITIVSVQSEFTTDLAKAVYLDLPLATHFTFSFHHGDLTLTSRI